MRGYLRLKMLYQIKNIIMQKTDSFFVFCPFYFSFKKITDKLEKTLQPL